MIDGGRSSRGSVYAGKDDVGFPQVQPGSHGNIYKASSLTLIRSSLLHCRAILTISQCERMWCGITCIYENEEWSEQWRRQDPSSTPWPSAPEHNFHPAAGAQEKPEGNQAKSAQLQNNCFNTSKCLCPTRKRLTSQEPPAMGSSCFPFWVLSKSLG